MEKILSQDEINALFSTMSGDGSTVAVSPGKAKTTEHQVSKFDFCRSDRVSKDLLRSVQQLHANFARHYSSSLSAYLRAVVQVSLTSVGQVPYLEFLKLLGDPTLFCSISMSPLHGGLGMELSPPVAFPIIDMLLGGPGKAPAEPRALTEIEMQIVEGILKLALRDLKEAWRPFMEIFPQLECTETKPQVLQLVAPGEAVIAICFEIKVGDASGKLNLCIPSVTLKMHRTAFDQQLRRRLPDSGGGEADRIGEILRGARLDLSTEIRDNALKVEDLLNISVGDVIQLDHAIGDPIQLKVNGVPKFYARIIVRRGKRAVEVSHNYPS